MDVAGLSDPGLLRQAAWIGGVERDGTTWIDVTNPATGIRLGRVPDLGAGEALEAVAAARDALPAWRGLTAKARSVILRRWYDRVLDARSDLARLLTAEQGKPLAEAEGERLERHGESREGGRAPTPRRDLTASVCSAPWTNPAGPICGMAHGVANRVDRLKAIGNGQVPAVAALAWRLLGGPR
jgi:delta 1-pyrroline-5-carboxylate dehydrogenase